MTAGVVRVVYLAGDNRSGTTLLSRALGSYDHCIAVGELYDIWSKRAQGRTLCSCGAPFLECDFWIAVMDEAFGAVDVTTEQMVTLRASVQDVRYLPLLIFSHFRTPAFKERLRQYVSLTERLYLAIQTISGCDVVVDSSKMAAYALALAESSAIDVRLVHVVRDSRACVFSWRRLKPEATVGDEPVFLRQRPVIQSGFVWMARNALLRSVSRCFPITVTVRYEDLVRQPRATLTELAERLDIDSRSITWIADDEMLTTNSDHIFAGNPNRVERGGIRFRADEEWRTRMPWHQKLVVSVLTFPLLWHLGYIGERQQKQVVSNPLVTMGKQR